MQGPLFSPIRVGPLTLKNRFIKSATNEGMAKGAIVSKGLADFHEAIAKGGAAMTTVAYCAVSPDGRTFEDQVVMSEDSAEDLKALTERVHAAGGAASAQLTHSGCFSFLPRRASKPTPVSASGGFNKIGAASGRFTKKQMAYCKMDDIRAEFIAAAEVARDTGFDAVELHMGHGYLLSQFLSPIYNQRKDGFGGTLENRLRYPIQVLESVLEAVGQDLAVLVKISMTDGHAAGYGIEDGIGIAKALEAAGAHMIVLSNGLNAESVSSMFGSNLPESVLRPPRNMIERKVMDWLRISGFEKIDFHELYLLENALKILEEVRVPLCYLGGVQSVEAAQAVCGHGFEAIAMGRALIHDASLISGFEDGSKVRSGCTACNECVAQLHAPAGVYCVLGSKPNPQDHQIRARDAHLSSA